MNEVKQAALERVAERISEWVRRKEGCGATWVSVETIDDGKRLRLRGMCGDRRVGSLVLPVGMLGGEMELCGITGEKHVDGGGSVSVREGVVHVRSSRRVEWTMQHVEPTEEQVRIGKFRTAVWMEVELPEEAKKELEADYARLCSVETGVRDAPMRVYDGCIEEHFELYGDTLELSVLQSGVVKLKAPCRKGGELQLKMGRTSAVWFGGSSLIVRVNNRTVLAPCLNPLVTASGGRSNADNLTKRLQSVLQWGGGLATAPHQHVVHWTLSKLACGESGVPKRMQRAGGDFVEFREVVAELNHAMTVLRDSREHVKGVRVDDRSLLERVLARNGLSVLLNGVE